MTTAAKTAFNLKVLRRHDPSIVEIIDSASFVVLYNHQAEWTKSGVEGPMFLFRRDKAPYHGFFILNRNGVENFSADMTPDDDLEITPEFIIYRPDSSCEDDVYGIWIFESSQRISIGEQMLKLQQMASPPSSQPLELKPPATAVLPSDPAGCLDALSQDVAPQPESISLDVLFGGPAQASNVAPPAESVSPKPPSHEASLLGALFQNATIQSPAPPSAAAEKRATPAWTAAPTAAPAAAAPAAEATKDGSAQNLLALLGVKPPSTPASASFAAASEALQPSVPPASTDNAIRAAEAKPATPRNAEKKPTTEIQTTANGTAAQAPKMSDLIADGIKGRIGLGDDGTPLPRRDFVRELLSLVHTDPTFVDEIHAAYFKHVSG
ncbi:hypothetical protein ACQY0O_000864 [Thecaphora frezii]